MTTRVAVNAQEAMREHAAAEEGAKLLLDEARGRLLSACGAREKTFELLADDSMNESLLGFMAFVLGHTAPNRDRRGGRHEKDRADRAAWHWRGARGVVSFSDAGATGRAAETATPRWSVNARARWPYRGESYELDLALLWNPHRRLGIVTGLDAVVGVSQGEALTGLASLALGLQGRVSEGWNVTLLGRGGLAGSVDVGAVAALYSLSLVNHIGFDFDAWRVELSNLAGVVSSVEGIEIEDIELSYDLMNGVMKNGISFSRDLSRGSGGRVVRLRTFLIDTCYFGDDLWLEHVDEVGVGFGLGGRSGALHFDPIALDLSYVFGDDYDALGLRLKLRY